MEDIKVVMEDIKVVMEDRKFVVSLKEIENFLQID
jgi:hypothetical protein